MKNLIFSLVVLMSSACFANTSCSDASGTTRIVDRLHQGGAQPGPSIHIEVSDEQVYIQNTLVSEAKNYSDNKDNQEATVTVSDDAASLHIFEEQHKPNGIFRVYGQKVTLSGNNIKVSGEPVQLPLTVYVICNESVIFVP